VVLRWVLDCRFGWLSTSGGSWHGLLSRARSRNIIGQDEVTTGMAAADG
jgi:hypothetical protein